MGVSCGVGAGSENRSWGVYGQTFGRCSSGIVTGGSAGQEASPVRWSLAQALPGTSSLLILPQVGQTSLYRGGLGCPLLIFSDHPLVELVD